MPETGARTGTREELWLAVPCILAAEVHTICHELCSHRAACRSARLDWAGLGWSVWGNTADELLV